MAIRLTSPPQWPLPARSFRGLLGEKNTEFHEGGLVGYVVCAKSGTFWTYGLERFGGSSCRNSGVHHMFKVCWGALLYFKQRVLTTSKYDDHYMCHGQKSSCMGFSWVVVIYPMGILTMGIHPHEWIEDHPPGAQAQHGSTINRDPK